MTRFIGSIGLCYLIACTGNTEKPIETDTLEPTSEPDVNQPESEPDTSIDTDTSEPEEVSIIPLSSTDHLLRIAMTLKGTRPSLEEFEAVESDPSALEGIVDQYLEENDFGGIVRDIEASTLLVRTERSPNSIVEMENGQELSEFQKAYYRNEEPLALIEYVVMNNLPYTQILTIEGTLGSRYHQDLWANVQGDHDPAGPEWQLRTYTDGRGNGGVLTTNGWHARWASNPNNAHRLGAAQATAALICSDYLTGDVQLGTVDLTSEDAIFDAIMYEPSCVSCHQTMDPFASALFGYVGRVQSNGDFPIAMFRQADAGDGEEETGRPIGYYGLGGDNLTEVAALMAEDPRFSSCTARRYISWMSQRTLDSIPLQEVAEAQTVLINSGMNLKEMVKHIVLSESFAMSHSTDTEESEEVSGILHTRPRQLDRFFRDLTGFTWMSNNNQNGEYVVPTTASIGYRVHGGGIHALTKQTPVHMHSASGSAFLRSFAAEAAAHTVTIDFSLPSEQRHLLKIVELDTEDEVLLREQFALLHLRIHGERVSADSETVNQTLELFQALNSINSNREQVWKMLLTALFQDFRVATY